MIPLRNVLESVTAFATNDVVSAMPNTMGKFLAYMAIGSMRNNPQAFLKPYESTLKSFGILSGDGTMVDEQALKSALDEAFSQMQQVSWAGFTFTSADANKLYQRIGIV